MSGSTMPLKSKALAGVSLFAMAAFSAGAAVAAEAASPVWMEEITVTATHRAASVQDVPISVSALTGATLERLGADDLEDFAVNVAGLEFAGFAPGLNRITIRGISTQTGESSTGFYIDEMPVTADPVAQPDVKTFDVNRVEVLRGPQGTLFGESSLGGTVRIIMNQPDTKAFSAAVQGTVSNTRHGGWNQGVDAMVNVPLVDDRLALRVVASERGNHGYIDNALLGTKNVNDEDSVSARAALAWTPTEDLRITGTFHYSKNETGGEYISNADWRQFRYIAEPRDDESYRYNLTVDYDFPWAHFISSTSYFKRDTNRTIDQTGPAQGLIPPGITVTQIFDIGYDIFVQEARLVSSNTERLDWVLGAFYKNSKRAFLGTVITNPDLGPLLDGDNHSRFRQWAVFGEATLHVTDQLRAVAGVRYFEENDRFSVITSGALTGPGFAGVETERDSQITPRFSLTYDISDSAMVYATASKGFRAGGANPTKPIFDLFGIPMGTTYKPDTLWNFEVGSKNELLDKRLIINTAFYYMDWKKVQLPASAAGVFNGTFNGPDATSKGVELEITAVPVDNLTLTFAGNYTDATLDETMTLSTGFGPVVVAVEGNELPLVPKWKMSFGAEYRQPITDTWTAALRGSASFAAKRFNFADNNPAERLKAYSIFDLQFALESDKYDIIFFADNLTDEVVEYAFQGDPSLPAERFFSVGKPRTIGITVRGRF